MQLTYWQEIKLNTCLVLFWGGMALLLAGVVCSTIKNSGLVCGAGILAILASWLLESMLKEELGEIYEDEEGGPSGPPGYR